MAFPTAVNSQITDAVTQSNVKVKGETPATTEATDPNPAERADSAKGEVETDEQASLGRDRPARTSKD